MRKYGKWAGDPKGVMENPQHCIVEVSGRERWINFYQCSRYRGYGKDKLFCKQHAKKIESGWKPFIPEGGDTNV